MSLALSRRHRRAYLKAPRPQIRLTLMGVGFLGFCVLLGILGLVFGNLFLGLVSCFLGLSLLFSALGAWLNVFGLKALEGKGPEIFAEKEISYPITILAPGFCFALSLVSPYGEKTVASIYRQKDLTLPLYFPQRGRFEVPVRVLSAFPLGLFEACQDLLNLQILVFPRPKPARWEELGWAPKTPARNTLLAGEEFGEHAPFTGREPLTRIDWKASARQNSPVIYRFEDEQEGFWLDLDASPGEKEELLSKACFLLLQARQRDLKIGLVLNGRLWPPGTPIQRLLEALALA